jgi:alkanesulfonate monooxygenase SsuD/methylene tetrahydromethanopterin reductase-like flavin-dependent oxidoreductase (luciferase family)
MGPFYRKLLTERLGYGKEVDALLTANRDKKTPILPGAAERLARDVTLMGTFDEAPERIEEWRVAGADGIALVLPPWGDLSYLLDVIDAAAATH